MVGLKSNQLESRDLGCEKVGKLGGGHRILNESLCMFLRGRVSSYIKGRGEVNFFARRGTLDGPVVLFDFLILQSTTTRFSFFVSYHGMLFKCVI